MENQEVPGLNIPTQQKSDNRVVYEPIPPSQNMIIYIVSPSTYISALTSSVASRSFSTVTNEKFAVDKMVKSL